jgi:uncharacterized protein YacL
MNKTIFIVRIFFFLLCVMGSWLVCFSVKEWDHYQLLALGIGSLLGGLVILLDLLLKGFSLRGLTALSFGLAMGAMIAFLIDISPLFENGDPAILFLVRLALYVIFMYLGTVIALRGKDEFNVVIPYIRFSAEDVESDLILVDTSALIDGRIVKLCETRFITNGIVIPQFVLDELQRVADSSDSSRKEKGRKGLDHLNQLKNLHFVEIKIHESEVTERAAVDAKLVFLAKTLKAKLLTLDYNLAQLAEFQGVTWLNLNDLHQALAPQTHIGDTALIELVKSGKDAGQAVGYLSDGSMMVVNDGEKYIGAKVNVKIISILPSAGGKMVFAEILKEEK